ncbi:MAG: monovalent cation/H(+) antiporter subunit G [Candidatus Thermoplasmatota archaeon]|nr:monovalent cation/H(+) antiporter subunit G [Candidatus Thermoplasmatota archaeon]
MNIVVDIVTYIIIIIGCFVMFSAALGLYRFPDIYMRLHSSTKVNTGGVITILFGLILREGFTEISLKIIIIIVLVFILTPVVSQAIARSAHLQKKSPIVSFESHPKKKYKYDPDYLR